MRDDGRHIPVPEDVSYSYRPPRRSVFSPTGQMAKTGALFASAMGLAIALGRPRRGR